MIVENVFFMFIMTLNLIKSFFDLEKCYTPQYFLISDVCFKNMVWYKNMLYQKAIVYIKFVQIKILLDQGLLDMA